MTSGATLLVVGLLATGSLAAPGREEGPGMTGEKTAKGTPVVHMWACGRPDPEREGAGFPVLHSATHVQVYRADSHSGGYSHHSHLTAYHDTFYAMWSNHPDGEDGPGQRVLYATSRDGVEWDNWRELFPPPGPVKKWEDLRKEFSVLLREPDGETEAERDAREERLRAKGEECCRAEAAMPALAASRGERHGSVWLFRRVE